MLLKRDALSRGAPDQVFMGEGFGGPEVVLAAVAGHVEQHPATDDPALCDGFHTGLVQAADR